MRPRNKAAPDPPVEAAAPDFAVDDEFVAEASATAPSEPASENAPPSGEAQASEAFKFLAAQIVDAFGPEAERTAAAEDQAPAELTAEPVAADLEAAPSTSSLEVDETLEPGLSADDRPALELAPTAAPVLDEPAPAAEAAAPAPAPPPAAATAAPPPPSEAVTAMVPRISIHAFCVSQAAQELVRAAARDRRMERASTDVRAGGLKAAVELYRDQPTPALLLLEAGASAADLLAGLAELADVCDPSTRVIVIGQTNDIALYRDLIRQGVSEYLVPPLHPLQLIGAITTLFADPAQPFVGRQIAFCGAKGGVGASTLAHNVAHALSESLATAAVLVDLDLPFGTGGLDFNQDPTQGVADALTQPDRVDPVLLDRMMVKHTERLSLLAAPANLDQDYDITHDAYEQVIRNVRQTAPYTIIDLPHQWNRWARRLLLTSDEVVVVAEPDLACLRNAKNIVELVRAARPNDAPPRVVLNKTALPGRPEIAAKDFADALGGPPDLTIAFDAKSFGEAANNGQMLSEAAPKAKAAEQIGELVRLLTGQRPAVVAAPQSSRLSSLFRWR
ncbi:MAG TPA: AAA family ATPase [Caulobacteraceae bacterium]|nr:AAA family ATPase [Caulobacteraceae bacterium]